MLSSNASDPKILCKVFDDDDDDFDVPDVSVNADIL